MKNSTTTACYPAKEGILCKPEDLGLGGVAVALTQKPRAVAHQIAGKRGDKDAPADDIAVGTETGVLSTAGKADDGEGGNVAGKEGHKDSDTTPV